MGIQINGQTDSISAIDGSLTVSGADLGSASASSLNISGIVTASGGVVVSAGSTSAPSISPSGDSNTGIFFPSADTVCIGEGGTEVIRVNSSGNVGLGTINPETILTISKVNTSFDSSPSNSHVLLKNSSSTGQSMISYDINGTLRGRIRSDYDGNLSLVTNGGDFDFFTGGDSGIGTNRMKIDSSGRVTMPFQPAFFARPPASYDIGVGANIIGGTWVEDYDRTNSFSNGTFTAPVSGWYCLTWNVFLTLETTRQDAYILKNGTEIMREEINGYTGTFNRSVSVHGSYQLAANDTITYGVHSTAGNTLYSSQNPWGYACGFLVG